MEGKQRDDQSRSVKILVHSADTHLQPSNEAGGGGFNRDTRDGGGDSDGGAGDGAAVILMAGRPRWM